MTPSEQRIALAEACGFTRTACDPDYDWRGPKSFGDGYCNSLPDFLADLNAMHEAEGMLQDSQLWDYLARLEDIVCDEREIENPEENGWCGYIAFATAAQRAEALLRTLNLWEETA